MSRKREVLVVGAVLLAVAFATGAAAANGNHVAGSQAPEARAAGSQTTEVDEPDGSGHAADASEDRAEGPDQPIMAPDRERASKVALDYIGEGEVTGTEVGDEESYYEIEVTRQDGSQIDVQLDESFSVVGID